MKTLLSTFLILVLALFSFTVAQAQKANPHFNKSNPPSITLNPFQQGDNTLYQVCASGTVYGCGDASSVQAYIEIEGTAKTLCYNGGNDSGPVPGQTNISLKSPTQTLAVTNGHASFNLCVDVAGGCKGGGNKWHYEVTEVNITKITLWINGNPLDLKRYL